MFLVRIQYSRHRWKDFFLKLALQVNLVWLPQKVGTVKYFKTTEGWCNPTDFFRNVKPFSGGIDRYVTVFYCFIEASSSPTVTTCRGVITQIHFRVTHFTTH